MSKPVCFAMILNSVEKQLLAWYTFVQYYHLCKDHQIYLFIYLFACARSWLLLTGFL